MASTAYKKSCGLIWSAGVIHTALTALMTTTALAQDAARPNVLLVPEVPDVHYWRLNPEDQPVIGSGTLGGIPYNVHSITRYDGTINPVIVMNPGGDPVSFENFSNGISVNTWLSLADLKGYAREQRYPMSTSIDVIGGMQDDVMRTYSTIMKYDTKEDGVRASTISLEGKGDFITISNLKAGTKSSDAANFGQVEEALQTAQDFSLTKLRNNFNVLRKKLRVKYPDFFSYIEENYHRMVFYDTVKRIGPGPLEHFVSRSGSYSKDVRILLFEKKNVEDYTGKLTLRATADGAPVLITNVQDGAVATDATTVGQLQAKFSTALTQAKSYADQLTSKFAGQKTDAESHTEAKVYTDIVSTRVGDRITHIASDVSQLSKDVNAVVQYDRSQNGDLKGGLTFNDRSGGPVQLSNVGPGQSELDAVNFGQLKNFEQATLGTIKANQPARWNQRNGEIVVSLTGNATGDNQPAGPTVLTRVADGVMPRDIVNVRQMQNVVRYSALDQIDLFSRNSRAVTITGVHNGKRLYDAVNYGQLASVRHESSTQANAFQHEMNQSFAQISGGIRNLREETRASLAGAVASNAIRYKDKPGTLSVGAGIGIFNSAHAFAGGIGYTSKDTGIRLKASVAHSFSTGGTSLSFGASFALN